MKRLYDTFHEPFRRVCSRPTVVPEAHVKDTTAEETSTSTDDATELEGQRTEASKPKKQSNISVRSALNAAFAKYAERVQKQDPKGTLLEKGKGSGSKAAKEDD